MFFPHVRIKLFSPSLDSVYLLNEVIDIWKYGDGRRELVLFFVVFVCVQLFSVNG